MYVFELVGDHDALAVAEAATAATAVEHVAPGLATATSLSDRVGTLALTRRIGRVLAATDTDVPAARVALSAADLGPTPDDGEDDGSTTTVAVRARDVRRTTGVDTRHAERVLGGVLADRGFAVDLDDPDRELRALFAGDRCLLAWLHAEPDRSFAPPPTDRAFFQPGSMDPALARALVGLAGAAPGRRFLDPMCGTGGLLIEAGRVGADPVGIDLQQKMVRGSRRNCHAHGTGAETVARGDVTRLPLREDAVDAVAFDAPYGRQSKVGGADPEGLVAAALAEVRRVAPRAVVVRDRPLGPVARETGWTVAATFERRVHRSLTRHIAVLNRD